MWLPSQGATTKAAARATSHRRARCGAPAPASGRRAGAFILEASRVSPCSVTSTSTNERNSTHPTTPPHRVTPSYRQVAELLLRSLAQRGAYDQSDFCARLDALLDSLDGTPYCVVDGRTDYTDVAMRDVWRARKVGGRAGDWAAWLVGCVVA